MTAVDTNGKAFGILPPNPRFAGPAIFVKLRNPQTFRDRNNAYHALAPDCAVEGDLRALHLRFEWCDQGWGNRKGGLQMILLRKGKRKGTEDDAWKQITSECYGGTAPHSLSTVEVRQDQLARPRTTGGENTILRMAKPGDRVQLCYRCGAGGGHALKIRSLQLALYYHRPGLGIWDKDTAAAVCFSLQQGGRLQACVGTSDTCLLTVLSFVDPRPLQWMPHKRPAEH